MTSSSELSIELTPSSYDAIRVEDDGTLVLELSEDGAAHMRDLGFDLGVLR